MMATGDGRGSQPQNDNWTMSPGLLGGQTLEGDLRNVVSNFLFFFSHYRSTQEGIGKSSQKQILSLTHLNFIFSSLFFFRAPLISVRLERCSKTKDRKVNFRETKKRIQEKEMEVPQPLQQLCNILKAIGKNKFFLRKNNN